MYDIVWLTRAYRDVKAHGFVHMLCLEIEKGFFYSHLQLYSHCSAHVEGLRMVQCVRVYVVIGMYRMIY